MAEAFALPLHENSDIQELIKLLSSPAYQSQRHEYISLLNYVEDITQQYNTILTELNALKEKVSGITDKKSSFVVMVERLDNLSSGIGMRLTNLKDSIVSSARNTLNAVKEKGLSALGSVLGFLHVKDGLQAMSNGLAKSVDSLNKAVSRVEGLEEHNRHKNDKAEAVADTEAKTSVVSETQTVSLADLLADTRMDFENLSQDELTAVYEKLLSIGMDNGLTANENVCLQSLVEEVGDMLPETRGYEPVMVAEAEQGAEM